MKPLRMKTLWIRVALGDVSIEFENWDERGLLGLYQVCFRIGLINNDWVRYLL